MIKIKIITHWLLLIVAVLYMVSGYGIVQSKIITGLTFGLLDKLNSFKLHGFLDIPFILLLILHLYFVFKLKIRKSQPLTEKKDNL